MLKHPFDRRNLIVKNASVALAHPFNPFLGVPTTQKFSRYMALIAESHHRHTKAINLNLNEFCIQHHLQLSDLDGAIRFLTIPRNVAA